MNMNKVMMMMIYKDFDAEKDVDKENHDDADNTVLMIHVNKPHAYSLIMIMLVGMSLMIMRRVKIMNMRRRIF